MKRLEYDMRGRMRREGKICSMVEGGVVGEEGLAGGGENRL